MRRKILFALLVSVLTAAALFAQESAGFLGLQGETERPEFQLELDWASKYVDKGVVYNNQALLFGDLSLEFQGLYLGVWGAYNLSHFQSRNGYVGEERGLYDSERKWRFEEVNPYVGYYYTFDEIEGLGPLTLDLSWTYNHYPTMSEENSAEFELSASLDELYKSDRSNLALKLSAAHDYKIEESWIILGSTYTYALDAEGEFELQLDGELYWGDTKFMREYDANGNGLSFAVFELALNWQASEWLCISPYLGASCALDSRVRDWTRQDDDYGRFNSRRNYWGGLRATMTY
ncbi:MAG: hypothetical protein RBT25_02980 [Lentisphaeria bacterium]|nr:hypothetical protein [Lentisphaeria bacterium]NLZ59631.1 hypothetical protein [Lentisphaerota bacterium]